MKDQKKKPKKKLNKKQRDCVDVVKAASDQYGRSHQLQISFLFIYSSLFMYSIFCQIQTVLVNSKLQI